MGTGMKVFLIIGLIVLLILGVIVGGGVYLGFQAKGSVEEAEAFAQTANKEECIAETARRTGECEGAMCMVQGPVFGMLCLSASSGASDDICDSGTSPTEYAAEFCEAYPDSEFCDAVVQTTVTEYCKTN